MDKWAVATKCQTGWALYEDAARVMVGECGIHSESRFMTPFILKPTTTAMNLKLFEQSPKEKPARNCAGFALHKPRR